LLLEQYVSINGTAPEPPPTGPNRTQANSVFGLVGSGVWCGISMYPSTDDHHSTILLMRTGVAQGSILGHFLYIMYITDSADVSKDVELLRIPNQLSIRSNFS